MARAQWPTSLPKYFERESLNVVAQPNKIITRTEVGPTRSRRRSTLRIYRVTGNLFLTASQRDTLLNDFYHTTLGGGTQRFDWHHPWNINRAVIMKFLGETEPAISPQGSLIFIASLNLEMTL